MHKIKIILLITLFSAVSFYFIGTLVSSDYISDRLSVKVFNPPKKDYYFTILQHGDGHYAGCIPDGEYDNALMTLFEYEVDGWKFDSYHSLPLLTSAGVCAISEHYYPPESFKLIVVTEDGFVQTSQVYELQANLSSSYTYDYEKNRLVPELLGNATSFLNKFLVNIAITIFIEGIILLFFKFKLKQNLKVFLLVNFSTRAFLAIATTIITAISPTVSLLITTYLLGIVICISEAFAYRKLLKGHTENRRVAYAILANSVIYFWLAFFAIFFSIYFWIALIAVIVILLLRFAFVRQ